MLMLSCNLLISYNHGKTRFMPDKCCPIFAQGSIKIDCEFQKNIKLPAADVVIGSRGGFCRKIGVYTHISILADYYD
jgi:hypothetical protein